MADPREIIERVKRIERCIIRCGNTLTKIDKHTILDELRDIDSELNDLIDSREQ